MPNEGKHKPLRVNLPLPNFGELEIDENDSSTMLGEGGFGKVYKTEMIVNGVCQTWAVKILTASKVEMDKLTEDVRREVNYMVVLNHENIIKIFGVATNKGKPCMMLEYADNGSFEQLMYHTKLNYTRLQALEWMSQTAAALAYLHTTKSTPILHRDINPANILLSSNRSRVKLANFGIATSWRPELMTNYVGKRSYIAPEVFSGSKYDTFCDVYSLAIVMFEVFSRQLPYPDMEQHSITFQTATCGLRPAPLPGPTAILNALIEAAWAAEPTERPSADIIWQKLQDAISKLPAIINLNNALKIGKGSFGTVYMDEMIVAGVLQQVAIKKLKYLCEDDVEEANMEINHMSILEHENIIKLLGVAVHKNTSCLLLEYAAGGSLDNLLHNSTVTYNSKDALKWICQIASALSYMHTKPQPILHRDLNPKNILLTKDRQDIKVADFGLATVLRSKMTNNVGTTSYVAPEVFLGKKYATACDVYSLAIVSWEVLIRKRPYENDVEYIAITYQVLNGRRPSPIPEQYGDVAELMKKSWSPEPDDRPTAGDIFNKLMQAMPIVDNSYNIVRKVESDAESDLRRT